MSDLLVIPNLSNDLLMVDYDFNYLKDKVNEHQKKIKNRFINFKYPIINSGVPYMCILKKFIEENKILKRFFITKKKKFTYYSFELKKVINKDTKKMHFREVDKVYHTLFYDAYYISENIVKTGRFIVNNGSINKVSYTDYDNFRGNTTYGKERCLRFFLNSLDSIEEYFNLVKQNKDFSNDEALEYSAKRLLETDLTLKSHRDMRKEKNRGDV